VTGERERDQVVVRGVVDRVAASYGAVTVLTDEELGDGGGDSRAMRLVPPWAWTPDIEPADLVVSFDASTRGAGWEEYLTRLAKRAKKALLVFAPNTERVGWPTGLSTTALARVLWQLGRVREHAYLGLPRVMGASEVVQAPAGMLVRRTARTHVFVVDTAPRTPQARRRLRTVGEEHPEEP
jgi:hypothetical protein